MEFAIDSKAGTPLADFIAREIMDGSNVVAVFRSLSDARAAMDAIDVALLPDVPRRRNARMLKLAVDGGGSAVFTSERAERRGVKCDVLILAHGVEMREWMTPLMALSGAVWLSTGSALSIVPITNSRHPRPRHR